VLEGWRIARNPGINRLLQMLILADDLSGAADCGVACVSAGLETIVALRDTEEVIAADVLSLDSDTRSLPPDRAASEVRSVMRHYAQASELLLFKKIDSTLRGNVGSELAAALDALRAARPGARSVAIMAPAFPEMGRTTLGGTQYLHGRPLHDLDIWRVQGLKDHAHMPAMLESAGLTCILLDLDCIRAGKIGLAEKMKSAALTADVLVCDAEIDDDLFSVAYASMQLEHKPMWVGSAGLAYQLPRAAGIAKSGIPRSLLPPAVIGSALFVIGSLSRNSQEQVRQLAASTDILSITVAPEILLAGDKTPEWRASLSELKQAISTGKDVVLTPGTDSRMDLDQRPRLAAALAQLAASVRDEIGALIASGGETARAVFEAFGITRLRLSGELERGIPISITENWRRPLRVITKAGDFGGADALIHCSRYLHAEDPRLTSPCQTGKVVE
jgi:D-threonate/D-erythronate kinase